MINTSVNNHPRLILTNYKQFKRKTEIILAPLTILVGPNGGGKSSIISALQVFSKSLQYIFYGDKEAKSLIERISFDEIISIKSSNRKNVSLAIADDHGELLNIRYSRGKNGGVKIEYFLLRVLLPIEIEKTADEIYLGEDTSVIVKIYPEQFNIYKASLLEKIENQLSNVNEYLDYGGGKFFHSLREMRQKFDQSTEYRFVKTAVHSSPVEYPIEIIQAIEALSSAYFTQLYGIEPVEDKDNFTQAALYWATIIAAHDKDTFDTVKKDYPSVYIVLRHIFNSLQEPREEQLVSYFNKLDDTRKDPPEYFEYRNGIINNDYYELCDYLLNGIKDRNSYPNDLNNIRESFINHLKNFEIADDITIEEIISIKPDLKLYRISLRKDQELFDLSMLSSGGKQILPVILKLFVQLNPFENLMISQPELHLHPRLQSQITDLLVDFLTNISISEDQVIVVETHSEHLIRKLQLLIARKKFNENNVSVFYINPKANAFESEAVYLPLSEKGLFTKNWPDGFFNDATILTLDLVEELTKRQN